MKKVFLFLSLLILMLPPLSAEEIVVFSPDKNLKVSLFLKNNSLKYGISYNGKVMLEESPLGLITNVSDFSKNLTFIDKEENEIREAYVEKKIKKSEVDYHANELISTYETSKRERISVIFRVSNNDVAFKYTLAQNKETARCIVLKELTGFKFPKETTTFLTPQALPLSGWMKTKPSYEEGYVLDAPLGEKSKHGLGFTFPGLFRIGKKGWVLVSETGVSSLYCGSKLGEPTYDGLYSIAFPEKEENNGIGSAEPAISLPGETPWRTITVGKDLKPIVETTVAFDVVKPFYEPHKSLKFGRSTWSWLLWQDPSINYEDQKTFIDLSSKLGYEFVLIDAGWDVNIGRERIAELARYGRTKKVDLCLWYNSNGFWNDAPQTPKNLMNTSVARKKEMAWMQSIGIKGIKVDFFGGDKQETMKLYEDILSDANDYGLTVIFHGCTLPRGWERMYPNFAGSEAVLASENLIFNQHSNDIEAFSATLHPFIRNAVGAMDFGPVLLNKHHNRNNDGGNVRKTTETFQLATAVLFQSPIQNFGITPNNLTEMPPFVIDFMKKVPTTWDETLFIEGYPGEYVVLARRKGNNWYIAGINADKKPKKLKLTLPMLSGKIPLLYNTKQDKNPVMQVMYVNKRGKVFVTVQPESGFVIVL